MQQYVQINLQFVQMHTPRLDRLTALLEGLSPKVTRTFKAEGFSLHITKTGASELSSDSFPAIELDALSLLVCPAGNSLQTILEANQRCLMSFEVVFDGPMGPGLLAELSQPISIGMDGADPSLVQVMTLIANEMQAIRCGQPLFINRVGDILLISLMRHLTSRPQHESGLFLALSDPRIARSLVAMHTKPAHPWTLEILASLAGMSRTSFANYFKDLMQVSPGKYLENLRLAIARQLVQNGLALKQVAARTGYASPSTLSRALGRCGYSQKALNRLRDALKTTDMDDVWARHKSKLTGRR
jgi:AraC-like DNA-binding protein